MRNIIIKKKVSYQKKSISFSFLSNLHMKSWFYINIFYIHILIIIVVKH